MPPCRLCRNNCSAAELHSICHKSDNHSIWCESCIIAHIEKSPKGIPVIARCQLCNSENEIEYQVEKTMNNSHTTKYVNGHIDGLYQEYYDADKTALMYEAEYKEGKVHGYFKEYDEATGCLMAYLNYSEDLMDGLQMYYNDVYEDGEYGVAKEASYQMGVLNGATTYYARNTSRDKNNNKTKNRYTEEQLGRIWKIEFYADGKLNGDVTTYHIHNANKIPKKRESYKNGQLHGSVITYDETGAETSHVTYVEGRVHTGPFTENVKFRVIGEKEEIDGMMSGQMVDGKIEGEVIYYVDHNNGNQVIYKREEYVNNQRNGKSIHYNMIGAVAKEEMYKEGVLHGNVTTYTYNHKISGIKCKKAGAPGTASTSTNKNSGAASAGAGSDGYESMFEKMKKEKEEILAKFQEDSANPMSIKGGLLSSSGGYMADENITGVSFSSKMGFGL